ncbi:MAG: flagellar filament capping protein FliD [Sulfuricella sp.]|nr:flagellar filament capping protein FliD [Sulfuricella sp.]
MDMLNSVSATRFDDINRLSALSRAERVSSTESAPAPSSLGALNSSFLLNISGLGKALNALSSLQSALAALFSPTGFGVATSSNPAVATALTNGTGAPGYYTLQVNQLAQAQVLLSAGQTSKTAAIGSGAPTTLTFQFGATNNGVFTANSSQPPRTVTIGATNNSLRGIATAINSAGIGVKAFVIADSGGFHLELASATTGAASGLKIGVSGDQTLADLLTFNPEGTKALTQVVTPQDASFVLDGVAGTSPSNTLSGNLPGITVNLAGTGNTTLFVNNLAVPATDNFSAFIAAFNTLNDTLNSLNNSLNGILGNASLLLGLQTQFQNILSSSSGLALLGITTNSDGSLSLNSQALGNILNTNPGALTGLFSRNVAPLADQIANLVQSSIFSIISTLQTPQVADQAVALQAQNLVLMNLLVAQQNAELYFLKQLALPMGTSSLGNLLAAQTQLSLLDSMVAAGA